MANDYDDRPYTVGKGKPPVHTQFGKGNPGNPKGRPPGARNADTIIKSALATKINVKENGRDRRISKLDAVVTQLVNKAASGDLKAIDLVLRLHREIEARALPTNQSIPLSNADRAVLQQFLDRVRTAEGE